MRVSKNSLLNIILVTCILLIPSCKQLAKKATANTAKQAEQEVYEKGIRNAINEVGSGPLRNMPWESIIRSLEKDNPILAIGIKKLSKKFQSSLSERIAKDPVLLEALLSSRTVLDEYKLFIGRNNGLLRNTDLFIWFVKTDYLARRVGNNNPLAGLSIIKKDGIIQLVEKDSKKLIGTIDGGIVSISASKPTEISSLLSGLLIPNYIYKINNKDGSSFTFFADELGRIKSVQCRNISGESISSEILGLKPDIDLGPSGNNSISSLSNNNLDVKIHYKYKGESSTPSYIDLDAEIEGQTKVKSSFKNEDISAGKLFSAIDNAELVNYYGKKLGLSEEKMAKLLQELNEDDELAELIYSNPEYNIRRWLNTRNKPDLNKIAREENGSLVRNGKVYAGNVFYFDPRLNSALRAKLKQNGSYKGYTYEQYLELDRLFPDGVPYTEEGFPDFIKAGVCMKDKTGKTFVVEMPNGVFNKDRDEDFNYARKIAKEYFGDDFREDDYIWHHIEGNPARLVLVRTQAHEACVHTGGHSMRKAK